MSKWPPLYIAWVSLVKPAWAEGAVIRKQLIRKGFKHEAFIAEANSYMQLRNLELRLRKSNFVADDTYTAIWYKDDERGGGFSFLCLSEIDAIKIKMILG